MTHRGPRVDRPSLTATEQREKYKAQAVEYAEVHEFPGATKGARKTREKVIRFICITDATAEPNSEGYWMKLSQWNRYRKSRLREVMPTPTIPSMSSS